MENFKSVRPEELSDNMFSLISKDWTLITAGDMSNYNMMTASWGGVGFLWAKNVCFLFIRHSRYTYEFTEKCDTLSLNFFGLEHRETLNICGKKSGRDIDKMHELNLTPVPLDGGGTAFAEARIIMNCKKLSTGEMSDFKFIDKSISKYYEDNDYHKIYICEITEVFVKE